MIKLFKYLNNFRRECPLEAFYTLIILPISMWAIYYDMSPKGPWWRDSLVLAISGTGGGTAALLIWRFALKPFFDWFHGLTSSIERRIERLRAHPD